MWQIVAVQSEFFESGQQSFQVGKAEKHGHLFNFCQIFTANQLIWKIYHYLQAFRRFQVVFSPVHFWYHHSSTCFFSNKKKRQEVQRLLGLDSCCIPPASISRCHLLREKNIQLPKFLCSPKDLSATTIPSCWYSMSQSWIFQRLFKDVWCFFFSYLVHISSWCFRMSHNFNGCCVAKLH